MGKYINADRMIREVKVAYEKAYEEVGVTEDALMDMVYKFMQALLMAAPAEDVAPVVHSEWKLGVCQNCQYDWGKVALTASVPDFCPGCGADCRNGVKNDI